MFKYGKKAGYMGIALLVLAVIPLVVAVSCYPQHRSRGGNKV